MKRQKKEKRTSKTEGDVAPNIGDADSVVDLPVRRTHNEMTECDRETRKTLTKRLHELLNTLWGASIQIELAFTEEACPEEFHESLEQVRSHILEAMEIASRTSTLIDSSPASILDESRAGHGDPS